MSGLLTPDQAEQLRYLSIATIDDEAMARIKSILAAQTAAEKALAALRDQEAINREILASADRKMAEAATMAANAEAKRRELAEHEARMAEVSSALNAEKKAFEEVRASVNADQKARGEKLIEWEKRLAADQEEVKALSAKYTAAVDSAINLASTYTAKHKRLHDALMANEADECPAA